MDNSIAFLINQGADWTRTVFVPNGPVNPAAPLANVVNLRGCSAVLTAARLPGAAQKLFTLSSTDGALQIDADAGSISWSIPAATTAQLTVPTPAPIAYVNGCMVYVLGYVSLKIINAAGVVIREFVRQLYLSLDV